MRLSTPKKHLVYPYWHQIDTYCKGELIVGDKQTVEHSKVYLLSKNIKEATYLETGSSFSCNHIFPILVTLWILPSAYSYWSWKELASFQEAEAAIQYAKVMSVLFDAEFIE